jgi:hypothetical protein
MPPRIDARAARTFAPPGSKLGRRAAANLLLEHRLGLAALGKTTEAPANRTLRFLLGGRSKKICK